MIQKNQVTAGCCLDPFVGCPGDSTVLCEGQDADPRIAGSELLEYCDRVLMVGRIVNQYEFPILERLPPY